MQIFETTPPNAKHLVPLLYQVHSLHVAHDPANYAPFKDESDVIHFLEDWLGQKTVTGLVTGSVQKPSGYLIFERETRPKTLFRPEQTRGVLHHICVDADHRRQGIGAALIANMKARLLAEGIERVQVIYGAFNTASAALMQQAGFSPTHISAEAKLRQSL